MSRFTELVPLLSLALIFAATLVRGFMLKRQGIETYSFGYRSNLQSAAEKFWKFAVILVVAASAVSAFMPGWQTALGAPPWSAAPSLRAIAAIPIAAGTLLVIAAQAGLGQSWRIGVPASVPADLVTSGLYRWSRNPIFVGMFLVSAGIFLWTPNLLTAAQLPLAAAMMSVQVRIEEEALLARHGEAYAEFVRTTRRWIWPFR